jgi:hypothetical protein
LIDVLWKRIDALIGPFGGWVVEIGLLERDSVPFRGMFSEPKDQGA